MSVTDPFLVRAVDHVRRYSQDTLDEVRWPASSIAELIDTANGLVLEYMLENQEPKSLFRLSESTVSVVAGTEDYVYPGNFRRFLRLVKKDSNGNISKEILPCTYLADSSGVLLFDKSRGFRLTPKPTSSEDFTLVYEPGVVPYLAFGRCNSGSSTTSVILSQPVSSYTTDYDTGELGALGLIDQFYTNSYLWIKQRSSGLIAIARVTGWTASSLTATVASALPFTPASGDLYQIMPCLDHPFDKAIMWRAVMMMKAADGDRTHRQTAEAEFRAILTEVMEQQASLSGRFGPTMDCSFMEDWDFGRFDDAGLRFSMGWGMR